MFFYTAQKITDLIVLYQVVPGIYPLTSFLPGGSQYPPTTTLTLFDCAEYVLNMYFFLFSFFSVFWAIKEASKLILLLLEQEFGSVFSFFLFFFFIFFSFDTEI